jgi:hypothetical protein
MQQLRSGGYERSPQTATTHTANRCKQARDNDVRKLKQDIFNLVFVKRHACPASFYERTL